MVTSSDFEKAVSEILGELEPVNTKSKVLKVKIGNQSASSMGDKVLVHDDRDIMTIQALECLVDNGTNDQTASPVEKSPENLNLNSNSGDEYQLKSDQETEDDV